MPTDPQGLGNSPRIKRPVKVRKRGVKERKGRVRERGEERMAAMYRAVAATSAGNNLNTAPQNPGSTVREGARNNSGQRKGRHHRSRRTAISHGLREENQRFVR